MPFGRQTPFPNLPQLSKEGHQSLTKTFAYRFLNLPARFGGGGSTLSCLENPLLRVHSLLVNMPDAPKYLWDSIPAYRLQKEAVNAFLVELFGNWNYYITVGPISLCFIGNGATWRE